MPAPRSTPGLILSIWGFLSKERRIQLGLLLLLMVASGAAELVSLGAVVPFLSVLNDPRVLWQQPFASEVILRLGLTDSRQLLLTCIIAFCLAAVLAAIIRLANLWANSHLAGAIGSDLSCEAYRRTLHQPYEIHVQRNSSKVITCLTNNITRTVGAFMSFLQLTTGVFVAVGLVVGLLLINWRIALSMTALFGCMYGLLAITARKELVHNSHKIAISASQQIKALQEGMGAIRDVLLEGIQDTYVEIYRQADRPQRMLIAKNQFLSNFPRFAVEALGLIAIALLGGLLVIQKRTDEAVIPLLGSLALGAQRLIPALQQTYSSWSSLKNYQADLEAVLELLDQPTPLIIKMTGYYPMETSIRLELVSFKYGPDQPVILNDISLEIFKGERIGIIGKTGSGKSTMVDLIMGLLKPTTGKVFVDGKDIYDHEHPERIFSWRSTICHVPQNIYLADNTIGENIAFGAKDEARDTSRIQTAAKQAQISDYIESCPNSYQTFVGERGIRLSGGQMQRIGIARALYKNADIIVLDEATSALDNTTEESVMSAIESLGRNITIIMIAHRLSTLSRCDRIISLEDGRATEVDPSAAFSS